MRKLAPSFITLLLLVAAPLLSGSTASAQQVADVRIDRGTVSVFQPVFPNATYDMTGPQSSVHGAVSSDDIVISPDCSPCLGGDTFNVHGSLLNSSRGSITFNGVSREIYLQASLTLTGGSVRIPYRYSRLPIRLLVPATVSGRVTGFNLNPFEGYPGPPVFSAPISLQGTATLTLIFTGDYVAGKPMYRAQSIIWNLLPGTSDK